MAIRNFAIPWMSGGALLIGYAAFAWLRSHRRPKRASLLLPKVDRDEVEPLAQRLERVPEELVLDMDSEFEVPPQSRVRAPRSALGDLFLAHATAALSPGEFGEASRLFAMRSRSQAR